MKQFLLQQLGLKGTFYIGCFCLLQAEEADFTADLHGNWTLENAKSRLHQFLQTNRIKAEYKYSMVGPDHNRFDRKWLTDMYSKLFERLYTSLYLTNMNCCGLIENSWNGIWSRYVLHFPFGYQLQWVADRMETGWCSISVLSCIATCYITLTGLV